MADVFISYKKEDRANVERIVSALQNEGLSVWWDDSLTPKASWDSEIERELSQAAAALVLWTPLSAASDWVRTEAHFAQERGKLIPVMLENCKLPIAFLLKQTIDLTKWRGARDDRHWRKLLTWIVDLAATKPGNANIPQALASAQANPFRDVVGKLATGESIVDGTLVNESTPAGTVFSDGQGLPAMRIVPKGGFLMGASDGDPDRSPFEGPRKRVEIHAPIAIGVYPLLVSEFTRLTGVPPKPNEGTVVMPEALEPAKPAVYISFDDASATVARLAAMTGMPYRLPSEAEWEYCCRARSQTRYAFGDAIDTGRCTSHPTEGLSLPRVSRRTPLVSTTCTAMCASGRKISGTTLMSSLRRTAVPLWRGTARCALLAAAVGGIKPRNCAHRPGSGQRGQPARP